MLRQKIKDLREMTLVFRRQMGSFPQIIRVRRNPEIPGFSVPCARIERIGWNSAGPGPPVLGRRGVGPGALACLRNVYLAHQQTTIERRDLRFATLLLLEEFVHSDCCRNRVRHRRHILHQDPKTCRIFGGHIYQFQDRPIRLFQQCGIVARYLNKRWTGLYRIFVVGF